MSSIEFFACCLKRIGERVFPGIPLLFSPRLQIEKFFMLLNSDFFPLISNALLGAINRRFFLVHRTTAIGVRTFLGNRANGIRFSFVSRAS